MNQVGDWYATTAPENKYQYNGKERDSDLGLNWDHYGFRMYDSSIGRFTGVDPIADQFAHVSVYNYAENDPVGHIDLWGLQKYKPKIQQLNGPGDLLSTKMLNNLWEGAKTMGWEFLTKEVGQLFKTTGSAIEYTGLTIAMAVPPIGGKIAAVGKGIDIVGTGIVVADEFIENQSISSETAVEVGVSLAAELAPEPLEDAIDKLEIGEVGQGIFKAHRNAAVKAVEEGVKAGVKELVKSDDSAVRATAENNNSISENCTEECNK